MQHLEVSCAVRRIYKSLGFKENPGFTLRTTRFNIQKFLRQVYRLCFGDLYGFQNKKIISVYGIDCSM